MSVVNPPLSNKDSVFATDNARQDSERRARSERVDYKALHNGRPLNLSPIKKESTSSANKEANANTSISTNSPTSAATSNAAIAAQRSSLSAQRSAQREQKLRSDPLVEVHGPVDVTCRRCGTHIKLSTKSSYDPFHWHRHIERCSKRPTKVVKQIKEQGKGTDTKKRSSLQKGAMSPLSSSSSRSGGVGGSSARTRKRGSGEDGTPPLTPDKADDDSAETIKEDSPNLSSPPPHDTHTNTTSSSPQPQTPNYTHTREDDPEFEEYLLKSRRKLMREFSPDAFESWKSWSWSQLKEPVWVVAEYPNQQIVEGNNGGGGGTHTHVHAHTHTHTHTRTRTHSPTPTPPLPLPINSPPTNTLPPPPPPTNTSVPMPPILSTLPTGPGTPTPQSSPSASGSGGGGGSGQPSPSRYSDRDIGSSPIIPSSRR